MSVADRPRPRLVVVPSTLGRHLFAFVWLPRDDLSTRRRVAIGEMLSEAGNAALLSWSIAMEDGVVALLRYTLDMPAAIGRASSRERGCQYVIIPVGPVSLKKQN